MKSLFYKICYQQRQIKIDIGSRFYIFATDSSKDAKVSKLEIELLCLMAIEKALE